MSDESELKELFESATLYVRTIGSGLDSAALLYLYSRFKQANEGPCNAPRPGMFDFKGKQKWDAWKALGDKSQTDSMQEYVSKLSDLDPEWELKIESGKVKPKSGMGVAVSTMNCPDEAIPDDVKTVFDWCKEGNSNKVIQLLTNDRLDINAPDESGMTILHWACDRGYEEMVDALLTRHADANVKDTEGQTPLHYGILKSLAHSISKGNVKNLPPTAIVVFQKEPPAPVSCEHSSIVRLLVSRGADTSLADASGTLARDCTDNPDIIALIS